MYTIICTNMYTYAPVLCVAQTITQRACVRAPCWEGYKRASKKKKNKAKREKSKITHTHTYR